ncbi:MAG: hypothetical protein LBD21_00485 [Tannerellaceae bacterium]|jgi:hypothetical protein|nr:hypothetical protein [Tannerellaceae bacterium]
MKKTLQLTLILAALIFSFSCKKITDEYFLIAEQMVDSQPENAMILLKSVDKTNFPDSYHARWAIALTHAQDKINGRHTSDSLIQSAIRYYEQHHDPPRLIEAYYYMGRVAQSMQNAPLAQEYYLKAVDVGEAHKEFAQLSLVCNQLGQLYTYQYAYGDALAYLKKADDNLIILHDTAAHAYVLRNIARTYGLMDSLNRSIEYYKHSIAHANSALKPSVLAELGERMIKRNDYDSAYIYLREAVNTADDDDLPHVNLYMGRYFVETNKTDSAITYLNRCIHSPDMGIRTGGYMYLAKLSRNNRRYPDYVKFQTQYESLRDTLESRLHTQTIIALQALYDYQKIQKLATKAGNERNFVLRILLIVSISAFIITLCLSFIIIKISRKRQRDAEAQKEVFRRFHNLEMNRTQAQIEINMMRVAELEKELVTAKKNRDTILYEINLLGLANIWIVKALEEQEKAEKEYYCSNLYLRLHNDRKAHTVTAQELELFIALTDKRYPNFRPGLTTLLKVTSHEDLCICYLLKAKVRKANIGRVLKLSRQAINNRCRKLSDEAFGADCLPGTLDQVIKDI